MKKKLSRQISLFSDAVKNSDINLSAAASKGKKIIGYFCTNTPLEVIHASGFLPVRITGTYGNLESADSLVPVFTCPYMRTAIEKGLNNGFDYLSGIVNGYSCDAACGLVNIWENNIKGEIYHTIPLPYSDGTDSRRFYRSMIANLAEKLNSIGGKFSEGRLAESSALYGKIRNFLILLYEKRMKGELDLSAHEFYTVVRAGFITPPEDYFPMIEELINILESGNRENKKDTGVPVLVSGSVIDDSAIFGIIEESGGRIAADDLCTGWRSFQPAFGSGHDPIEQVIDRYMNKSVCPARGRAADRFAGMKMTLRESDSRGVIFVFQKFCTPHFADQPILKDELKSIGIPSTVIEIEETGIHTGQARTRIESFIELLR